MSSPRIDLTADSQRGRPAAPAGGTRRSVRGHRVGLGGVVLAGVLAGIAAKISDESGIGWVADLGTYPAVWVLALALIARAAPAAGASAVMSGAFFAAMVGGYGWAVLALGFPWGPELLFWLTMAAFAVPVVTPAVWWAMRSAGAVAGMVLAAVATLAVVNGATFRAVMALAGHLPTELLRPVQVAAEIAVTICVILVFPRHRRTRWWAIGAWLPSMWLVPRMLDQVVGRIGLS